MTRPVALITGGGQGIGAATCKRLADDGYDILLTYNNSSKPAEMLVAEIRENGGDALAVKVDCSDSGEVGLLGLHPWMAKSIDVLVENKLDGQKKLFGRNQYMNSVIFEGNKSLIGKNLNIKIEHVNQNSLFGKIEKNNMRAA